MKTSPWIEQYKALSGDKFEQRTRIKNIESAQNIMSNSRLPVIRNASGEQRSRLTRVFSEYWYHTVDLDGAKTLGQFDMHEPLLTHYFFEDGAIKGKSVMDVGAADGGCTLTMAHSLGAEHVYAIEAWDFLVPHIETLRDVFALENKIDVYNVDVFEDAFDALPPVDVLLCANVLCHVNNDINLNKVSFLNKLAKKIVPCGYAVITTASSDDDVALQSVFKVTNTRQYVQRGTRSKGIVNVNKCQTP